MNQWLIVVFAGNLIVDYLSLVETRLILSYIRNRGWKSRFAGLVIDVILTLMIFWLTASSLYAVELLWQQSEDIFQQSEEFVQPYENILDHLSGVTGYNFADENFDRWTDGTTYFHFVYGYVVEREASFGTFYADFYRISALTTYFTSIWIWLFILAAPVGRALYGLRGVVTRWGKLFNVKDHPVATLGYTLAFTAVRLTERCWL